MALRGPLPAEQVDAWVQRRLKDAPEHLTEHQRRTIRAALAGAEPTNEPETADQAEPAPPSRRAG